MAAIIHNKLVRDKIPQIIAAAGKRCSCRELSGEEYLLRLEEKLGEELAEYLESRSMEEMADLLEVMMALAKAQGYSWASVEAIREEKARQCGGFDSRIFLCSVTDEKE